MMKLADKMNKSLQVLQERSSFQNNELFPQRKQQYSIQLDLSKRNLKVKYDE